jgi:FMN phosphatase YigB (HAD superfamily)
VLLPPAPPPPPQKNTHTTQHKQGLRKPAPAAYEAVTAHLQLPPQDLIFIDDRQPNVDAAAAAGMGAVKFSGCAAALEQELRARGLVF